MIDDGLPARIRMLIGEDSERKFARDVGVNDGTLRSVLKGTKPSVDFVVTIAKAKGVSVGWLAAGEGERTSIDPSDHQTSTTVSIPESMVFVPVLDVQASAGNGAVVDAEPQTGVMALRRDMLRSLGISSTGSLKILEARGNSMEPLIRAGDLLLVDTSIDRVEDEGVYVFRRGSTVIVKRLRLTVMGGVELVSDNGNIAESISPHDLPDLHAAGRVVRVIRAI